MPLKVSTSLDRDTTAPTGLPLLEGGKQLAVEILNHQWQVFDQEKQLYSFHQS